jgi:hypothetical protein
VLAAKTDDALLRPPVAAPREQSVAIEHARDQLVRADPSKNANRLDDVLRRVMAILARATPSNAERRVNASLPVNHQDDLPRGGVNVDDDLVDERANDPLLQPDIGRWRVPDAFKIER